MREHAAPATAIRHSKLISAQLQNAVRRVRMAQFTFLACILLAGCGGSSTRGEPKQPPVITSTALTLAVEGQLYSYSISAIDPAGGAVTLTLTEGPQGATLNGSTLSWTPTWEQSRKPNFFGISATNTQGLTAKQSWTVSPSGNVYARSTTRYFAADGTKQQELVQIANPPSIYLPNASDPNNGYLKEIRPTLLADGTLQYSHVPAGPYYAGHIWTDRSGLYSEQILPGRRTEDLYGTCYGTCKTATATGTVAGVLWEEGQDNIYTQLAFRIPNVRGYDEKNHGTLEPNATVWNGTFMLPPFDAAKGDLAFVTEMAPTRRRDRVDLYLNQLAATASMDYLVVGDGADVPFSTTLAPVTKDQSFRFNAPAATWAEALQQMQTRPGAFVLNADFGVSVAPFLPDKRNAYDDLLSIDSSCGSGAQGCGPPLLVVSAAPGPDAVWGLRTATDFPAVDLDLGTFYYGNPFPHTWGVDFSVKVNAAVQYAIAGNEPVFLTAELGYVSSSLPGESQVISPVVTPVTHIMVEGQDASTGEVTYSSITPTVSWTPPVGVPRIAGYIVSGYMLEHNEFCLHGPPTKSWCWSLVAAGGVTTRQTSVTLAPGVLNILPAGTWVDGNWKVYAGVLQVRIITDPDADLEVSPVYTRPTGWADSFTQLIYSRAVMSARN